MASSYISHNLMLWGYLTSGGPAAGYHKHMIHMLTGVLGGECLRSFDGAFSECKDAFIFAKPLRFALALHCFILALSPLATLHHCLRTRTYLMQPSQKAFGLGLDDCHRQSSSDLPSDCTQLNRAAWATPGQPLEGQARLSQRCNKLVYMFAGLTPSAEDQAKQIAKLFQSFLYRAGAFSSTCAGLGIGILSLTSVVCRQTTSTLVGGTDVASGRGRVPSFAA